MKMPAIPINWFDFVVLATLVAGIIYGRKRGMSEEITDLLKWLAILVGAAYGYKPLSAFIRDVTRFQPLNCNLISYVLIIVMGFLVFAMLKRLMGEKLFGSDTFGPLEYPLGMIAGAVRCACILLACCAFINAKLITDEQFEQHRKQVIADLGSEFFPSLGSIQRDIFRHSLSGPYIKRHLSMCLIDPTAYQDIMLKRDEMGGRKERELDEVMGGGKKR